MYYVFIYIITEDEEEEEEVKSEGKSEGNNRRDLRGRECKQVSSTQCVTTTTTTTTTNNNSSKRKTRNRGIDQEKDGDFKNSGNNNNNNHSKAKDDMKGKTAINGDATEEEKISIKTEVDDEKLEIKEEPGTTGNGSLEPVSETDIGVIFYVQCFFGCWLFLQITSFLF